MISMVRDHAQNVGIIFGEGGLLSAAAKGKTIIVMSTLDPDLMNELGKKVEEDSELRLISAAVSGGASGAQAGTLSIMTSGLEKIVKSFQPILMRLAPTLLLWRETRQQPSRKIG